MGIRSYLREIHNGLESPTSTNWPRDIGWRINIDPNPNVLTTAFSIGGCVNLFYLSQGSSDSVSVGFVHMAKGEVVYLDPKRGMIKLGILDKCKVSVFIKDN